MCKNQDYKPQSIKNPNNYYNHGLGNTFDYNHCMCIDYLLYTITASGHLICYLVFVTLL